MTCPNLSNPQVRQEFNELKQVLGEDMAYLMWDRNNGFHLDKTRDGKPSKLFNDLLGLTDRKTALEIKAKTLSNSFKNWFGESKVVDENGEPLVVYHGGPNNINNFIQSEGKYGELYPIFFSPNYHYAEMFSENLSESNIYSIGKVYPVFLRIENLGKSNKPIDSDVSLDLLLSSNNYDGIIGEESFGREINNETSNLLLKAVSTSISYSVRSSNQIKSIFNSGVFNRYSDNIYDNETINQETNRQQTKINGSMSQEIVSNFETYFPDYAYFTDEQRKIVADLTESGNIELSCTI